MSKTFFLIGIWLLIYICSEAQNATPNPSDYTKVIEVLPPSPHAASLGKYGGLDISLATGMMNTSIPLYELSSIDLKVPIALSYSGNGLRVDELAGRVGTGWSLNAGGVITRTVYGFADEYSTRQPVPADFPARTRNLINYMDGISNETANLDGQPDLFSFNFNGYSGRFILDSLSNPLLLTHSNLKIEKNLFSGPWNFKITTGDGVQYFFGGDSATEKTKKAVAGTGCGKPFSTFIPTAWYLQKIVHPNGDIVTLKYSGVGMQYATGTNETLFLRNEGDYAICGGNTNPPPTINNTACESILQTSGVVLGEINCTGGTRVVFNYMDRRDGSDKLCTRIDIYQPAKAVKYKMFNLNYLSTKAINYTNTYSSDTTLLYRYFLKEIIEKSADSALIKKFSFDYNDIASLPPRLSFAQDHYGFFNGKSNTTTQIPVPSNPTWKRVFPQATADRSLDPAYCQKGMLSAITYPTGGRDTILYEANQAYKEVTIYPADTSISLYVSNTAPGAGTIVYSSPFTLSMSQSVHLVGSCRSISTTGGDPLHDQTIVDILDETSLSVYNTRIAPGSTLDVLVYLTGAHTYKIKLQATGEVEGSTTVYYTPGTSTTQYMNVNTGGVRVAKVITSDLVSNISNIKKYIYARKDNLSISSGVEMYSPVYEKYLRISWACVNGLSNCALNFYGYYSMYSNTQNNLYVFPSSPVSYSTVFESMGENYENGGTEHDFTTEADKPSHQLCCNDILIWGPLSSYAWRNARETYKEIFKKQGGINIPVKRILTSYKEDTRIDQEIKGYFANKKYAPPCTFTTQIPQDYELNAYDLHEFSYFRKWVYVDTIRIREYDMNGQAYVETMNVAEYGNPSHAMVTKQTSFASDSSIDVVQNYYPQDVTLIGSEEMARQTLVAKNMVAFPLQQLVTKNSNPVFKAITGYNNFVSGLTLPKTKSLQIRNAPIETRLSFNKYDTLGRIIEQSKTDDVLHTTLWGYKSMYVIADCLNTDSGSVAYTSFEGDDAGNWIIGSPLRDTAAFTGRQSLNLSNGGLSASGLMSGKSYYITYWTKTGSKLLSLTGLQTAPELLDSRNGWNLYRHSFLLNSGANTVWIGGSGVVDEFRLYPEGAQMTTFTYDPLIGITTQCDPNNRVTYYEYDGLGRLKLLRDKNRNIVKTFEYKYQVNTNQ